MGESEVLGLMQRVEELERWKSSFITVPVDGRQLGVESLEVHTSLEGSIGQEFVQEQLQTIKSYS